MPKSNPENISAGRSRKRFPCRTNLPKLPNPEKAPLSILFIQLLPKRNSFSCPKPENAPSPNLSNRFPDISNTVNALRLVFANTSPALLIRLSLNVNIRKLVNPENAPFSNVTKWLELIYRRSKATKPANILGSRPVRRFPSKRSDANSSNPAKSPTRNRLMLRLLISSEVIISNCSAVTKLHSATSAACTIARFTCSVRSHTPPVPCATTAAGMLSNTTVRRITTETGRQRPVD